MIKWVIQIVKMSSLLDLLAMNIFIKLTFLLFILVQCNKNTNKNLTSYLNSVFLLRFSAFKQILSCFLEYDGKQQFAIWSISSELVTAYNCYCKLRYRIKGCIFSAAVLGFFLVVLYLVYAPSLKSFDALN